MILEIIDVQLYLVGLYSKIITKRIVLQIVAKCYDSFRLLSSFVIRIKILMQEMCEHEIDWDSALPDALIEKFVKRYCEIKHLRNFEILISYFANGEELNQEIVQIYMFGDTSFKGHFSVSYVCVVFPCETPFAMSKTRLVSLNKITLPRLELLATLISTVR